MVDTPGGVGLPVAGVADETVRATGRTDAEKSGRLRRYRPWTTRSMDFTTPLLLPPVACSTMSLIRVCSK